MSNSLKNEEFWVAGAAYVSEVTFYILQFMQRRADGFTRWAVFCLFLPADWHGYVLIAELEEKCLPTAVQIWYSE